MALLSTQTITDAGITVSWTTISETSNTFTNSGSEFIAVKLATGAETTTVTVVTQVSSVETIEYGTLTKSNSTDSVTAENIIFLGPFPVGAFATSEGVTTFTVSQTTGVQAAIFSY